jgi:hypothetical protein
MRGSAVGYIPAAVGGRKLELAAVGKVFDTTPENLTRWRAWWRYLHADQVGIWAAGCFVGLALPALITVQFVPPGTSIGGFRHADCACAAWRWTLVRPAGGESCLGMVSRPKRRDVNGERTAHCGA